MVALSIDLGTLISVITVLILAVGAFLGIRQLAGLREEQRLRVFMTYSQRYADVMQRLPDSVRDTTKSIFDEDPPESEMAIVKNSMRQLFGIFSDEFYLNSKGLIEKRVWGWWEGGMEYHMGQKSYRDVWFKIFREGYEEDFVSLIDSFAKKGSPAQSSPSGGTP